MGESGEVRLEPLHFITNGVLFEGPATLLGIPFVGGVLAAPFRKDLSHSSLIHDSEFIAALEGFKRYAEEMVLRRMLSSQDLPAAVIQVLTEWTPLLLSRFAERGERENQALLERWMEERRFLSDLRSDSAWRSLLTKLAFLPIPAREESARRLRHGLLKAVREYLEWCDLKTVQSLCEKIRELVAFQEKKLLPAAEQSLFIITTLLGQPALDSEYVPGNLRVSALRLKGKISEALEAPGDEQQRSMLTLASGYIEESISRLEALVLTENPQVEAVEALSDAYLLCAQKEKRCQALQFRLEAVRMRATQDPSLEEFLREDLAAIARRCSSFRDFIYWRSRAASSKLSYRPLMEFQEAMQSAEKSLKRGSVAGGAITLRTALVKLEKTFPLLSPYHPVLPEAPEQARVRVRVRVRVRRPGRGCNSVRVSDRILLRGFEFRIGKAGAGAGSRGVGVDTGWTDNLAPSPCTARIRLGAEVATASWSCRCSSCSSAVKVAGRGRKDFHRFQDHRRSSDRWYKGWPWPASRKWGTSNCLGIRCWTLYWSLLCLASEAKIG